MKPELERLAGIAAAEMPDIEARPVETWSPPDRGPIDIEIDIDGQWSFAGEPIRRPALVAVFASILRREEDGSYALVTPVEKRTIQVADVPFVATGIDIRGNGSRQTIVLTINTGQAITVDGDHPLRFAVGPAAPDIALPYVLVRGGLEARAARPVYYDLVDAGKVHTVDGEAWFGVWSGGHFWQMQPAAELET